MADATASPGKDWQRYPEPFRPEQKSLLTEVHIMAGKGVVFCTTLDDSPGTIVPAFDQIRERPNYPVKTVVSADAEEPEVRVLTYDYRL